MVWLQLADARHAYSKVVQYQNLCARAVQVLQEAQDIATTWELPLQAGANQQREKQGAAEEILHPAAASHKRTSAAVLHGRERGQHLVPHEESLEKTK